MEEVITAAEEAQDSEQRIDWLRMRGVEIEFPSDRKKAAAANCSKNLDISNGDNPDIKSYVTVVKIPCDDNAPYEQLQIPLESGRAGDQLPLMLRVFFNRGSVQLSDLQHQQREQFANTEVSVTQSTLDRLGAEGSVEVFPLAHANDANSFCRVALYLDEVGQLKKLPPNRRTAALAASCGFQDAPLVGDMFVGRTGPAHLRKEHDSSSSNSTSYNGSSGVYNLDFSLAELNSDAAWLRDIERLNYEHGVATGRVAMPAELSATAAAGDKELVQGVSLQQGLRWSETAEFLEVAITIPSAISKFTMRDIKVKYEARRVLVQIKNTSGGPLKSNSNEEEVADGQMMVLWDGQLHGTISIDDCTWCLSGCDIEISLEKAAAGRWGKLEK